MRNNLWIPNEVTETMSDWQPATIAKTITVYKRNDDTSGLYYKYNGDLFRISTETPWLKEKIAIPTSEDRRFGDGEIFVNSCEAWRNKLEDMLWDNNRTILKSFENTEYNNLNDAFGIFIKDNQRQKVCDILLWRDFFRNQFCWISNIENKMKIIQLVWEMRLAWKTSITSNDTDIINDLLTKYRITRENININNFITEYNKFQNGNLYAFGLDYPIQSTSNWNDQAWWTTA